MSGDLDLTHLLHNGELGNPNTPATSYASTALTELEVSGGLDRLVGSCSLLTTRSVSPSTSNCCRGALLQQTNWIFAALAQPTSLCAISLAVWTLHVLNMPLATPSNDALYM
eukprot:CAMPEP_0172729384 /NCGR_PEP_ID=MMETSP1074-20121228/94624_1 /TAXON_ID=2916 /ORGANISM="Ceratium fusus, Strain PA161109" /LENGTH=111 /DNA_ID=CAMNT_0013556847 /DNA_START=134 /DNA_END=468 /DNA_ORIENTATION=+